MTKQYEYMDGNGRRFSWGNDESGRVVLQYAQESYEHQRARTAAEWAAERTAKQQERIQQEIRDQAEQAQAAGRARLAEQVRWRSEQERFQADLEMTRAAQVRGDAPRGTTIRAYDDDIDSDHTDDEESSTTQETAMTAANLIDSVKSSVVRGAKTAAADQVGNTLLDIAKALAGDKLPPHALESNEGQAVAKLMMAVALHAATDLISNNPETQRRIRAACGLQIEAASRDFVEPKLAELAPLFQRLIAVSSASEE